MAVGQAIPLAVETLTALQVVHDQGLIHRDLKPANIFLTPHGVKILDFGLARPASSLSDPSLTQTATRLTQAGIVMGTPRYMAPEQIQGRSTDARTDLFAIGAMLFEMLSGGRRSGAPPASTCSMRRCTRRRRRSAGRARSNR